MTTAPAAAPASPVTGRETCAWCHESRPRSGMHRAPAGQEGFICHDWYGCYQRLRGWMIREGLWTDVNGKLYPVGRNRPYCQAAPGSPVLWAWTGPGQVEVCRF